MIILKILDTLYMFGVRLLYHGKVLFFAGIFLLAIFISSINIAISQFGAGLEIKTGVYFLNVGQGDSILIITKQKQIILIDTGSPLGKLIPELKKILSDDIKRIDILILTHPDADHDGDVVSLVKHFNIGLVLHSPIYFLREDGLLTLQNFNKTLPVFAGVNLQFSENESLDFLSPGMLSENVFDAPLFSKKEIEDNNFFSAVSSFKTFDKNFLLMADAPIKIEKVLVDNMIENGFVKTIFNDMSIRQNILKAGHHGSKTSSAEEFVKKINPTDVIFSYGKNNRYKHPSKEIEEMFQEVFPKTKIHRTTEGTVYFGDVISSNAD